MKITLLTDNAGSWIVPYAREIMKEFTLGEQFSNHEIAHVHNHDDIEEGDIMFILSCEQILSKSKLALHKNNIVIHPSKLPEGKGWSPLAWQILEGKNTIPISLFEATEAVDAGEVYLTDKIELKGHELNGEIKHLQGEATIRLVLKFLKNYSSLSGTPQSGEGSFYRKMKKSDNEIDPSKSLEEQFEILRIVDNDRYPAFFKLHDREYVLKIYKNNE